MMLASDLEKFLLNSLYRISQPPRHFYFHTLLGLFFLHAAGLGAQAAAGVPPEGSGTLALRAQGSRLLVESRTFTAEFDQARLVSVKSRQGGVELLRRDESVFPLELVYANGDRLREDKGQSLRVKPLTDRAARILIAGNDSDRELLVWLDPATGDLCVTPSGRSARRGLLAARWNLSFAKEAALVLPCINGMFVESDRPFPSDARFPWPFTWNAQLAIAQRDGQAIMVHSQDTACKFKALNLARRDGLTTLGFDSEQVGPVWENRAAGGIEWRLNVYGGDWQTPARRYRDWMSSAYRLQEKRAGRPAWVTNITFAFQWSAANPKLLEALAKIHPPERTLIHLAEWRTSKYDVNYPDYTPAAAARDYMEKAGAMGFKVMPHFNYFSCWLKHPLFEQVRDWQIRSAGRNEPEGWYWPPETHDYTRMAYIHPGSALWRRTLIDAVLEATAELNAPAAFLDQTLCTWNTDNGLVENLTTVEGLRQMEEEFAAIRPGLVLAGEGLNEVSFQRLSFAQGHIHDGWGDLKPYHVAAAHPIGSFLWEGQTRLVGYYHLGPQDKSADLGIEVYRRMGAIPTLICGDPALITPEQPVVKKLLDLATAQPGESAVFSRSVVSLGDPARLERVLARARRGESVSLGVIGGSITQGASASRAERRYGERLAAWWRQTFPNSAIRFVNAGIGATGSDYGALRAGRDLLSHQPDFVVAEYAVNDPNGEASAETLEGLVRQVLRQTNQPAVVLLFMMTKDGGNAQEWHSKVGRHYELPMLSYRDALWPDVKDGVIQWSDIEADVVHPNDCGHDYAARFITRLLDRTLAALPADDRLPAVKPLPAPLISDRFEHVTLLEAEALKPSSNQGWTLVAGAPGSSYWKAEQPGSAIEFEVPGPAILLMDWHLRGPMGRASVRVDDRAPVVREAWFDQTWGGYRQTNPLARDLGPGKHKVRLEILPDKDPQSTGHEFRVMGLGVAGSRSRD